MKYVFKLTVSILVLLSFCLSLSGYLLIQKSFQNSVELMAAESLAEHAKTANRIEQQTAAAWLGGAEMPPPGRLKTVNVSYLQRAAMETANESAGRQAVAVYLDAGIAAYQNLPEEIKPEDIAAITETPNGYILSESGGGHYLINAAPLLVTHLGATLVTAYDVSAVYQSRDQAVADLRTVTLLTLLLGAVIALLMSAILTRPLKKLETASEAIAGGEYSRRTSIGTADEIGSLGRSFDKMADAVETRIEQLDRSVRQRDDFVLAFTHEIKTPMTSMMGYAARLRKTEPKPEQYREAADYIYRETARLENLSQKLMQLMGLRQEELQREMFLVSSLFDSLKATLPRLPAGVKIDFSSEDALAVLADRILIDDLLRNLITNAIRACSDSGRVTVDAKGMESGVAITVSDNGIGIPPEELGRITDPFYMADKSRARASGNSGLGLAIGQKIAELHQTVLHFESEEEKGTSVSFSLPQFKEGENA